MQIVSRLVAFKLNKDKECFLFYNNITLLYGKLKLIYEKLKKIILNHDYFVFLF